MRDAFSLLCCLVLPSCRIALAAALIALAWPSAAQSLASSPSGGGTASFYRQPPVFVENRGQWDGDFLYKTRLGAMTVFVEKNGWTFTLSEHKEKGKDPNDPVAMGRPGMPEWEFVRGVAVRMRFAGSPRATKVIPGATSSGVHNYFLGNDPARWRTEIPLYEGIRLVGIWPGVDVGLRIEGGRFEYDVFVEPGAELSQVAFEVEGADGLRLDADGTPIIETPLGPVRQTSPRTWEIAEDGRKEPVACSFVLLSESRFGFAAPTRAPERPLVIDPGLVYSTYLGGGSFEAVFGVAVDAAGAATVTGRTGSTNFPVIAGAYDTTHNGGYDGFVARLNAAGSGLVYATYLGGSGDDFAGAIVLDATGAATVVGGTYSSNFPATAGAYDTTYNGGGDEFVARLNASGSGLVYATYLGGVSTEWAGALALDAAGAATVSGTTTSTNFPATAGAYDTTFNGDYDAFVARLNASGSGLVYATYLGGGVFELGSALALDAAGAATVTGTTSSTNFPATAGAYDTTFNGGWDAFVARLNAAGSGLVYATYLGGGHDDSGGSIALDAAGAATVAGKTSSTNFPVTAGAYDTSYNGGTPGGIPSTAGDAFVARLNAAGSGLVYATYLGGGSTDTGGLVLDAAGAVTLAGSTSSTNFPVTAGAYDTTYNGSYDVFVARLNAAGSGLVYATYFGGAGNDICGSFALDAAGAVTFGGEAESTGFPVTSDAFVVRLQFSTFASPLMAFPDVQSVPSSGILGIQVAGPAGAPVALMFDPVAQNLPVPPFGALGVAIPPSVTADGIGLGFPNSIPMPLTIGSGGMLYFSYSPVPASLVGTTLYVQAVAVDASLPPLPPFVGIGLSTHGNAALPTPACQVTFVP